MLFFNDPSPKFRKLIPNISKDMEDFIDSKQFIKGKSLDLLEKKFWLCFFKGFNSKH